MQANVDEVKKYMTNMYNDMATVQAEAFISGGVSPVRTGKSCLTKRFMKNLVGFKY